MIQSEYSLRSYEQSPLGGVHVWF